MSHGINILKREQEMLKGVKIQSPKEIAEIEEKVEDIDLLINLHKKHMAEKEVWHPNVWRY